MTRVRQGLCDVLWAVIYVMIWIYLVIGIALYLPFSKDVRDLVFRGKRNDPPSGGV